VFESAKDNNLDLRKGKLHIEEFHNLYSSPNFVRVTSSRRTSWNGYVPHVVEVGNMYILWDVGEHIILKWILETHCEVMNWVELSLDWVL